jgi:hypothetical protein
MITTAFDEHLYDNRQTCSCNKSLLADSLLITIKHFTGSMKMDQGEKLFSEKSSASMPTHVLLLIYHQNR